MGWAHYGTFSGCVSWSGLLAQLLRQGYWDWGCNMSMRLARPIGVTLGTTGKLVMLAGAALGVAGAITLIYQTFMWFAFGHWASIDLHDFSVGPVQSRWMAVNEVLFWLGRQSVGVVGILLGFLLARGGAHMLERHRDHSIGKIH